MNDELKPRPFCGQQEAFVEQLDSDASVVICQGLVGKHSACLARGPVGVQESDNESQPGYAAAVREWNTCATPQPPALAGKATVLGRIARNFPGCVEWTCGHAQFVLIADGTELVDRAHVIRLQAEIESLQEANLHHRNLKIEADDVIVNLRDKLQMLPLLSKIASTLLPYAENEAAAISDEKHAAKAWAIVEEANELLARLSSHEVSNG